MSFSKKFISLSFLAINFWLVIISPDSSFGRVFDRVVAKVNNEIITLSMVRERVEVLNQASKNNLANSDEKLLLKEAVDMIVQEKLLLQEGKKRGLQIGDEAVEAALKEIENKNGMKEGQLQEILESEGKSIESYKNRIRDQILVSKVTRFELGGRVKVSEREIVKFYQKNQKEYWEESKVKARHILLLLEKDAFADKKMQIYKKIKGILAEIKNGKDFADAAKEYSEDVSASSGGNVGYIEKGKMVPEFEEAVFSLKEGEISGVVETEFGFHLIKVDEVKLGRTLPLKLVKGQIQNTLASNKQKSAYENWMKELRASAFVEILLFEKPKTTSTSNVLALKKNETNKRLIPSEKESFKYKEIDSVKKKEELENRWVEMYKSVEKAKHRSSGKSISTFQTLEERLAVIKKLRSQKKITEAEYRKRKQNLLETTGKSISSFQSLEEKIIDIKELRSQEKITEDEYQKRRKQLLSDL